MMFVLLFYSPFPILFVFSLGFFSNASREVAPLSRRRICFRLSGKALRRNPIGNREILGFRGEI